VSLDRVCEVFRRRVDRQVRASLPQRRDLLRRSGRRGDPGAEELPEGDRREAHAGGPRVHEERLSFAQSRFHDEVHEGRQEDLGNGRRVHEVEGPRRREDLALRHGHGLGVPASGQDRADRPSRVRDRPGDLEAEDRRLSRRRQVLARDLREVGAVEAGGRYPHEDLAGLGFRLRRLGESRDVPAVPIGHLEKLHAQ
jgi:hypothetical protein